MDIGKAKNIHFVGIGGCGMSAIAKILWEMGKHVRGSDIKESPNTIRLKDLGIKVFIGHNGSNVRGADLVVFSSAIPRDNIELKAARSMRIPLASRADALSWILDQFPSRITIAGTHGKTTTTSMISTMLSRCGLSPTYLIGAEADTVEGNAKLGSGSFVVAEADESDGSFLKLHPTISVITNIEADHMEHYRTLENIIDTFAKYISALSEGGCLIINSDHANNQILMGKLSGVPKCIRFGLGDGADLSAANLKYDKGSSNFQVHWKGKLLGDVTLSIPGMQNVANALSCIAVGLELGLSFGSIRDGLRYFRGVKRRFQNVGALKGIMVIDDYAHHPTEIAMTLRAARLGWGEGRRIICVFQPHRYTRTMYLYKEFGDVFKDADIVVVTEIYSAGEDPIEGISAKLIAQAVREKSKVDVHYVPKKEKIAKFLLEVAKAGDIIITAGAGDISTVGKEFLARLKERVSGMEKK